MKRSTIPSSFQACLKKNNQVNESGNDNINDIEKRILEFKLVSMRNLY